MATVDRPETRRSVGARIVQLALYGLPVVFVVVAAWNKRFITDDGFINFRIVDQLYAGHGPVYNAGQRVEAYTSPAWLAVLVLGRGLFGWLGSLGQIAVGAGLAFTAGAVVLAQRGARDLARAISATGGEEAVMDDRSSADLGERADDDAEANDGPTGSRTWPSVLFVPAGVLVFVAFPPTWYWATSGLDTSLFVCWLGGSFAFLARTARRAATNGPDIEPLGRGWPRYAGAVLIASGWLIRPDAFLFSATFLAIAVSYGTGRRARLWLVLGGLAPSLLYQVFRMGYFASLVPNTALAKQANEAAWERGWDYLADTTSTYTLWPLVAACALLGVAQLLPLRRQDSSTPPGRRWRIALVAVGPVVAALVHAAWVIRVGGDYLHARFFFPTLFVLTLPAAVLPLRLPARLPRRLPGRTGAPGARSTVIATAAAGMVIVAVLGWAVVEADAHGAFRPDEIDQEPEYIYFAGTSNPIEPGDYPLLALEGNEARTRADRKEDVVIDKTALQAGPIPSRPGSGTFLYVPAIGVSGQAAGTDVWVIDPFGLADAIGSRLPPTAIQRAGHQKLLPFAVAEARFAGSSSLRVQTAAARRSLECGDLAELIAATEEPMSPGRFWQNVVAAPKLTTLQVPGNGPDMEERFCGRPA